MYNNTNSVMCNIIHLGERCEELAIKFGHRKQISDGSAREKEA